MSGPFTQPSLYDDFAGPSSGPATSHEAGKAPGKAALRIRVLRALALYGPQSDDDLAVKLGEVERRDSVGKRRQELVAEGLACPAMRDGKQLRHRTTRGSSAFCWDATAEGRRRAVEGNDDE